MKEDLTKQQKRSIVYYINKLCDERGYVISSRFDYQIQYNYHDLACVNFQYENKSEVKAWREYRKLKKYGFGKIKGLHVDLEFSTWSGLSGTIYIEVDFLEHLKIFERKEKLKILREKYYQKKHVVN